MDLFFRLEGIRGAMNSLRAGNSLAKAIEDGKSVSTIAVQIWNTSRDYQLHRWEKTAHDFVDKTVRRLCNGQEAS